jgi:hypothetical protein
MLYRVEFDFESGKCTIACMRKVYYYTMSCPFA